MNSTYHIDEERNINGIDSVWDWMCVNRVWIIGYSLAALFTGLVWHHLSNEVIVLETKTGTETDTALKYSVYALSAMLFFGAVAFVQIFTKPIIVTQESNGEDGQALKDIKQTEKLAETQKRSWMVVAYAFMIVALFATIIPYIFEVKQQKHGSLMSRPLSVFVGCVNDIEGRVPKELRCIKSNDMESKTDTNIGAKKTNAVNENTGMWIVNIGGQVENCKSNSVEICRINGGLVVPLYYIFLALLGGAISLTRRVPEFQLQASYHYKENDPNKPKLEPHRLREYLVFQIVQFISAPLIAVVAYYLISPDNIATSVAIAFTAGFSSEVILHMIRTLIDKITPQNAPKQNPV